MKELSIRLALFLFICINCYKNQFFPFIRQKAAYRKKK